MVFTKTAVVVFFFLIFSPLGLAADDSVTKRFGTEITVYKSPSCGCCAGWAEYLRGNGFRVTVVDKYDLSELKAQHGIRPELQSCHTAIVDGYAIEGHVPADDIWRLLAEKPDASGLTAPGMPMMSPGMNSVEPHDYDVLLIGPDSKTSVYSRY
jgi:hypothetical protein